MLTLEQAGPIANRPGQAAESYDGGRAAHFEMETHMTMAYESLVADAMCHLLTGFVMVGNLAPTLHGDRRSACSFDLASENIGIVLEKLNECSHAFWLLPQSRKSTLSRLREFCGAFKYQQRQREAPQVMEISSDHRLTYETRAASAGPNVREIDEALASAILQLVSAYRAIDALSVTPFPRGAPHSFELACCCLCTALVHLENCSLGCEGKFRRASLRDLPKQR